MGVSNDAILVYGVDLGDWCEGGGPSIFDDEEGDNLHEDIEGYLAAKAGIPSPYADGIWNTPEQEKVKEARKRLVEEAGVDLISHCHGSYPMWILGALGTQRTAHRGSPIAVKPEDLVVPPGAREKLKAFCEAHDMPWSEPRWLIASVVR